MLKYTALDVLMFVAALIAVCLYAINTVDFSLDKTTAAHNAARQADLPNSGCLRVTVKPPLPFSTEDENAQVFAFDDAGCAVDWSHASGPGSTCAE
ncbi:hypothetical protein ACSQ76_04415 [Roseovarius sp. B08]|uniref:hypothetical protein n=1 Tax=Roseovarius sp. B08 TaxID=3449223 RepID=UPI003EDC526E